MEQNKSRFFKIEISSLSLTSNDIWVDNSGNAQPNDLTRIDKKETRAKELAQAAFDTEYAADSTFNTAQIYKSSELNTEYFIVIHNGYATFITNSLEAAKIQYANNAGINNSNSEPTKVADRIAARTFTLEANNFYSVANA